MTTDDALESLSNRLRDVQLQLGVLKAEEVSLKHLIRDKVGDQLGTIEAFGKPVLRVTYGRRFNAEHAEDVLAAYPQLLALVTKTVVDSGLAKAVLPPALYLQCQKDNAEPTITPIGA